MDSHTTALPLKEKKILGETLQRLVSHTMSYSWKPIAPVCVTISVCDWYHSLPRTEGQRSLCLLPAPACQGMCALWVSGLASQLALPLFVGGVNCETELPADPTCPHLPLSLFYRYYGRHADTVKVNPQDACAHSSQKRWIYSYKVKFTVKRFSYLWGKNSTLITCFVSLHPVNVIFCPCRFTWTINLQYWVHKVQTRLVYFF